MRNSQQLKPEDMLFQKGDTFAFVSETVPLHKISAEIAEMEMSFKDINIG